MSRDAIVQRLRSLRACSGAVAWAEQLPADTTPEAAWAACERADWLLWIAARVGVDRRAVVLGACACARLALPNWSARYPDDPRPRRAIEVAERWARGEATLAEVRAASAAAYDAAASATALVASAAAAAAANAADTAACANDAACAAVNAAYAGVPQSDIIAAVRAAIPWALVAAALEVLP